MPNRLAAALSPYLQQHADNPVDWYPWGTEALERARREDKPILLSIGYSACHWCHVMAHESFADPETARIQNEHFVSIKVDREERPDLDQVYQLAVQVLGRQGGWPLTVFLTPDLRPFYGGTYFPPVDRHGMPSFKRVLLNVAEAYRTRRAEVEQMGRELTLALDKVTAIEERAPGALDPSLIEEAARDLLDRFDDTHGGFGSRPKFPNTMNLEALLRATRRPSTGSGRTGERQAVFFTLRKMAEGGIYDQLGGGFHRYATDERWLVPHFEKMLYDNALLPRVYLAARQATLDPADAALFERIARETLDYVRREMTHPEGGFYSTQDADSEGQEGKFFVWDEEEIAQLLGAKEAEVFCRALGVRAGGNFEHTGKSVLHVALPAETVAKVEDTAAAEVERIVAAGKRRLLEARGRRARPFRDEKIIAGWNGLMISAFAEGAKVLGEVAFLEVALRAADFLRRELWKDGRLLRTWKGASAGPPGYLDDYAFLAAGLLDLFEAGGRLQDFAWARELCGIALEQFGAEDGSFYLTSREAEPLVHRPRSAYDQMIPSGTGVLGVALLRLHALSGEERWSAAAGNALAQVAGAARQNPFGFGQSLCAIDLLLEGATAVVIAGEPGQAAPLVRAAHRPYHPNKIVVPWPPGQAPPPGLAELLLGKGPVAERPAAYVCRRGTCLAPISDPQELATALARPA